MTAEEVLDLLLDTRRGGRIERTRALAEALRGFSGLPGAQKRRLAILVAERAAPQLVPRIEAETGIDLTAEQVRAVLDMAGRLDDDDLHELRRVVVDEEQRGAALRSIAGAAAGAASVAAGVDDVPGDELDAASDVDDATARADAELAAEVAAAEQAAAAAREAAMAELAAERERVEAEAREALAAAEAEAAAAAEVAAAAARAPAAPPPPPPVTTQTSLEHPVDPTSDTATPESPAARGDADRSHADHPDPGSDPDHGGAGEGTPETPEDPLATTDELDVAAVPDGWRRRRAIDDRVRRAPVPPRRARDLLTSLARASDRVWVAGTLLEHERVAIDDVADLLPERAARRLAARHG